MDFFLTMKGRLFFFRVHAYNLDLQVLVQFEGLVAQSVMSATDTLGHGDVQYNIHGLSAIDSR